MWLLFSAKLNYILFESIIYFKTHFSRHFSSSPSRRFILFFPSFCYFYKKKNRFSVVPTNSGICYCSIPITELFIVSLFLLYTRMKLNQTEKKNTNSELNSFSTFHYIFFFGSFPFVSYTKLSDEKFNWRIPIQTIT